MILIDNYEVTGGSEGRIDLWAEMNKIRNQLGLNGAGKYYSIVCRIHHKSPAYDIVVD